MEEWEKEEGILDHWSHTHPLCLVEDRELASDVIFCNGCIRSIWFSSSRRRISWGEQIYVCSKRCGSEIAFHKECAEIPRKIKHPLHPQPQHVLMIQEYLNPDNHRCAFCKWHIEMEERMSYSCTSSECHDSFYVHLKCAQAWGAIDADADADADVDVDVDDEQKQKQKSRIMIHDLHHPEHELVFVSRRAGGSHSFRCDACGAKDRGDSYLCTVCDNNFWIHQKCASLPDSITMPYHHHPLSLAPIFPLRFFQCGGVCDICYAEFNPKHWVYHCQTCIYFAVHIKCAFKQLARYPITDVVEERIEPFVAAIRGKLAEFPDQIIKYQVLIPFHKHRLSLILLPARPPPLSFRDERKPDYICDGCITPVLDNKNNYMMRCSSDCNYSLHWACSQLPPQIPPLPLHNHHHHELVLESCSKLEFGAKCQVCNLYTNGLMYACKACDFKADIQCAVLPDSMHHKGHHEVRHLLSHFSKTEMRTVNHNRCDACARLFNDDASDCYVCDTCDFTLHVGCALLPEAIINLTWDKHHHLLLTYGTTPTDNDIYCDCCEQEISPNKEWVYRCDPCDLSFHPRCFPAVTGEYRNIKFGQQYTIAAAHPHPLAYQFLTIKRRCDICRRDAYGLRGFQCAPCYFFICLDACAQPLLRDARI